MSLLRQLLEYLDRNFLNESLITPILPDSKVGIFEFGGIHSKNHILFNYFHVNKMITHLKHRNDVYFKQLY